MCSKCGAIFNILLKVVIVELYCSFVVIRHAVNRHILESCSYLLIAMVLVTSPAGGYEVL